MASINTYLSSIANQKKANPFVGTVPNLNLGTAPKISTGSGGNTPFSSFIQSLSPKKTTPTPLSSLNLPTQFSGPITSANPSLNRPPSAPATPNKPATTQQTQSQPTYNQPDVQSYALQNFAYTPTDQSTSSQNTPTEQPNNPAPLFTNVGGDNPTNAPNQPLGPLSGYKEAYDAYIRALMPNKDVTDAQNYLNKLTNQSRADYEKALNSGETLGFAGGEAARVNRNNQFAIDAAANVLNTLQGSQTQTQQAEKARLDYLQSLQTLNKPVTLSAGQTLYDPVTNKPIYQAPVSDAQTKLDTSVQDIGGRKVLVNNQTGEQIKDLGVSSTNNEGDTARVLSVSEAKDLGVPYGTTVGDAAAKGLIPGTSSSQGNELKTNALQSAQQLLNSFNSGNKFAVGGTSVFPTIPGTQAKDFIINFNNLKSLLSLDNIKLLKGQGAVSDAERQLLSEASSKLDRGLSEEQFKTTLESVIKALSSTSGNTSQSSGGGSLYDF